MWRSPDRTERGFSVWVGDRLKKKEIGLLPRGRWLPPACAEYVLTLTAECATLGGLEANGARRGRWGVTGFGHPATPNSDNKPIKTPGHGCSCDPCVMARDSASRDA